jgi:hypothetical protein
LINDPPLVCDEAVRHSKQPATDEVRRKTSGSAVEVGAPRYKRRRPLLSCMEKWTSARDLPPLPVCKTEANCRKTDDRLRAARFGAPRAKAWRMSARATRARGSPAFEPAPRS